MSTVVDGIEPDRKTLRLRAMRQQHEARLRFWRVFAVSSFFVVVLGANLYIGAVVMMGNYGNPFVVSKAPLGQIAQIKRPLLDGTFCRNIAFDNTTSHEIEEKIERCDKKAVDQPRGRSRTQFSWGGR